MRLSISMSTCLSTLSAIARFADPKSTMPVLGHLKLAAHADGTAAVSATDLTTWGTGSLSGAREPGAVCVPARAFLDALKPHKGAVVEVSSDGAGDAPAVEIRVGSFVRKLQGMPATAFPKLDAPTGPIAGVFDPRELARMLTTVAPSISTDETRYHLAVASLRPIDRRRVMLVATDGHRLARVEGEMFGGPLPGELLIQRRTVFEIARLAAGKACGSVRIAVGPAWSAWEFGETGIGVFVKRPETTFPPFEQVIPARPAQRATVERTAFARAIREVLAAMQRNERPGIVLGFGGGACRITRETPETSAHVELPCEFEDDAPDVLDAVAVNGAFLLDALDGCTADRITLAFENALDPIRIDGGPGVLHVVMPMREDLSPRFLPAVAAAAAAEASASAAA